jgi:hypothetical protein
LMRQTARHRDRPDPAAVIGVDLARFIAHIPKAERLT